MHQEQVPAGPQTVLHVTQPIDGGVARVVTDLVRAQRRSGLNVAVACPPHGGLAEALAEHGVPVHPWYAKREPGARLARETLDMARVIRRVRPALVHAHSSKAGLAVRLALLGRVPTVFQPHAWAFEAVTGRTARIARAWERHAAGWSTRTLCVSDAERRRGEQAGIRARWAVVPNGVDTTRFAPADPAASRRVRAQLLACAVRALPGTPSGDSAAASAGPLVVCVGRLCRQKGQDVLLRAWTAVTSRHPGARLVLVGDGPEYERLRAQAPPGVLFTGQVADPTDWYAAADLVVLPSRWEGMALAPLEAMACARPVVLTDVGGARESLPAAHADTCLVPADDPGALAAAVLRFLTDPELAASVGREARAYVRATRDVSRTAAAVTALYRELAPVAPSETDREELSVR